MFGLWIIGVLKRRAGAIALAYGEVAMAVCLVGLIAAFSTISAAIMTDRALKQVVVDWQVDPKPGADPAIIETAVSALAELRRVEKVGYADAPSLHARTAGTVQTTGQAAILSMDASYRSAFSVSASVPLVLVDDEPAKTALSKSAPSPKLSVRDLPKSVSATF